MTLDDRWLAAVWPFARGQLPPAPARVLEVGCGSLGGFVPALLDAGYQAVGVDPEAPEGPDYQRVRVVVPDDGTVCWAYAWRSPTTGFRPLPHGWVAARGN